MEYWYQDWLLRMVDELKLHPRLAKLRGRTIKDEWLLLEKLVFAEMERLQSEPETEPGPEMGFDPELDSELEVAPDFEIDPEFEFDPELEFDPQVR